MTGRYMLMCKGEKTYRAFNLLMKYFPNTLSLIDKKYDFSILDKKYEEILESHALNKNLPRETNIVDVTIFCEQNNPFHLEMAKFLEGLVKEAINIVGEKHIKRLSNNFQGKFTNFSSWNYLNPFGEIISLMTLLRNDNYKLMEIEHEIPNRKSIDFLFSTTDNKNIAVEIINIHPKENYKDIVELENHIIGKLMSKIEKESKSIDFDSLQFTWAYLPVLWSTNLEGLIKYKEFFERFEKNIIKVSSKKIFILGFISFIQHIDEASGKRVFEYGYVTKLINKFRI
jgi:hypothetical protein